MATYSHTDIIFYEMRLGTVTFYPERRNQHPFYELNQNVKFWCGMQTVIRTIFFPFPKIVKYKKSILTGIYVPNMHIVFGCIKLSTIDVTGGHMIFNWSACLAGVGDRRVMEGNGTRVSRIDDEPARQQIGHMEDTRENCKILWRYTYTNTLSNLSLAISSRNVP